MRRKKDIPPELKVARAKRILLIFALMGIVCVTAAIMKQCEGTEQAPPIEQLMNDKLDSLLVADGFSEAVVTDYGDIVYRRYIPHFKEEDELAGLETLVEFGELKGKALSDTLQRIEDLKVYIKNYKEDKNNETAYYNRRIRFTSNGDEYTCIQIIDTTLNSTRLKHVMPVNIKDVEKKIKELENNNLK
jgi:hypothetical protein